jgi:hypothetical protein
VLKYQLERQRIDRLAQKDVMLRIHPPLNPHREEYEALVNDLNEALENHRLVGYHCTRLTPSEVAGVRADGLRVLSPQLIQSRFERCYYDGLISGEERDAIAQSQWMIAALSDRNGHRTGKVWLCPNRSTLKDSSAVYRLFRSWGGEAVYGAHDDGGQLARILLRVGSPVIVKCTVPMASGEPYATGYAERFLSEAVADEVSYPEPPARFDYQTSQNIPASRLLGLIEASDLDFEHLTGFKSWDKRHQIL